MADAPDTTPPAVDQTGNLTIWWVPDNGIAAFPAITAAELAAAGAKRVTYSFTPDGWSPTGDQAVNADERLTLEQALQSFGRTTNDLALKYVDSTDAGSAAVVLVKGLAGYLIERKNVPNATLAIAAQKVRAHPVTLGEQIPGPIDGNGKFTITQKAIYRKSIQNVTLT